MKKLSSCELLKASEGNFQMGGDRMRGKGEMSRKRRGFTGLEAAIVLTAFVVVAAVFSYVVLNAGFFTTQKSKEVVHTGVEQATSSAELAGDVIGYAMDYNGVILTTPSSSANRLNATRFYLQLTAGKHPLDMNGLTISYTDKDTHMGNLTYNASAGGGEINSGNLGLRPGEWNWTIVKTAGFGDDDNLLELGEKAQITVALPDGGVAADEEFTIEVKPAQGATLTITRKAPSAIDSVMDLT